MATAKKTETVNVALEPVEVPNEAPHYLDRYGHRHELSDKEAEEREVEQNLPALPPAD